MTLAELSVCYEEAAVPLRRRLRELRLLLNCFYMISESKTGDQGRV